MTNPPKARLGAVLAALAAVSVTVLLTGRPAYCGVMPQSFAGLAKEAAPSVVNISTTQTVKTPDSPEAQAAGEFFRRFYGVNPPAETERRSLGSGLIISQDGYILTNNHVVADAKDIKVGLPDGTVKEAVVVGRDERTDLALIKVDSSGLVAAKLGDSDALRVGDWVVAIGNPFGLSHTVTAGIVSAKGREIGAGPYDDFIQTDASINPGNSGGPLFNTDGYVVGINTAINAAAQGIGFAIPIDIAKIVVRDIREHGRVVRGWLGASAQPMTPELAAAFHLKEPAGLVVTEVEKGSPAEKAGLGKGDVIVEFAGRKITHPSEVPWLVASSKVGSEVPMKIIRDGVAQELTLTIVQVPEGTPEVGPDSEEALGFTVTDLTADVARQLGLVGVSGVIVSGVSKDGQAAEKGIRPGDLISEVNGKAVSNAEQFHGALKGLKPGDTIALYVQKPNGALFIPLKIK
jgi:serine protease Do